MAEAELNVNALTVPELIATAAGMVAALKDNEHFPDPDPSPAELAALAARVSAAAEEYRQRRVAAGQASIALEHEARELRRALAAEVAHVQEKSGGDIAKILSANLHVEEETSYWPFNRTGDVAELSVSMGDQPGEIDLAWDPVANASGYEVEIAYDITGTGPWEQAGATTRSKITIEKLTSHTRYWFRVRAVGERGPGDWSDPVMKFAP